LADVVKREGEWQADSLKKWADAMSDLDIALPELIFGLLSEALAGSSAEL